MHDRILLRLDLILLVTIHTANAHGAKPSNVFISTANNNECRITHEKKDQMDAVGTIANSPCHPIAFSRTARCSAFADAPRTSHRYEGRSVLSASAQCPWWGLGGYDYISTFSRLPVFLPGMLRAYLDILSPAAKPTFWSGRFCGQRSQTEKAVGPGRDSKVPLCAPGGQMCSNLDTISAHRGRNLRSW